MTTGEIIKNIRIQHNLTQEEFGNILGVKKSAIQKYESGAITNFKADILRKLYLHFDLPPLLLLFPEKNGCEVFDTISVTRILSLNVEGRRRLMQHANDLLLIDKYLLDR